MALVQSYIPAKSLEEWVKWGRSFNKEEIKQLAQGNILLGNRSGNSVGQVYLVDFGSVQTLAARKGSTITVVGTYGYMPPEQFGGRTVSASDLYSLGATLIYLVTGRHPAELSQDNLQIQFESAANLNPDLINWLKWMTQPSLNRRLASAGEALKALEHPRQKTEIFAAREKPFGSKIQIKKDGENVEIMIPPARSIPERVIGNLILLLIIFIMFSLLIVIIIPLLFQSIAFLILCLLASIFEIAFGCAILQNLYEIFAIFFRANQLHLNQEQISLTYEWPWCKRQKTPILKKDIKILESTDYSFYSQSHKITILARPGQEKYEISGYTEPEIEWLAHELSEWSGIPITSVPNTKLRSNVVDLQECMILHKSSKIKR